MKKYELLSEDTFTFGINYACIRCADYIIHHGHRLYRIKALKDFNDVKAGDIGGYISNEACLSQDGNCWVYDDAKVLPNARVYDNAQVRGKSCIEDNAKVYGNAQVRGKSRIRDNAKVYGNTIVITDEIMAGVYGNAEVCDNVIIKDNAQIYGNSKICGNVVIDREFIFGNAFIKSQKDFKYVKAGGYLPMNMTIFTDINNDIYFKFAAFEISYKDFCDNHKNNRFYVPITQAIEEFIQGRV